MKFVGPSVDKRWMPIMASRDGAGMTATRCPRCHAPILRARSHATGRPIVLNAEPAGWGTGYAVDAEGWASLTRRAGAHRVHACPAKEPS